MGLFSGQPGKPGIESAGAPDDGAAREAAERTESENPGWIVMFRELHEAVRVLSQVPSTDRNYRRCASSGLHPTSPADNRTRSQSRG
jgi:hypothetical protein